MWTATITDKGVVRDVIALQVAFSKEGEETIKVNFEGRTVDEINRTIKNYKEALDNRDTELSKLTTGDWAEPIMEEVVAIETPEEIATREFETAKAEWLKKKEALTTMVDDMERGKLIGIDADLNQLAIMKNLGDWVNANMKQEYYF